MEIRDFASALEASVGTLEKFKVVDLKNALDNLPTLVVEEDDDKTEYLNKEDVSRLIVHHFVLLAFMEEE